MTSDQVQRPSDRANCHARTGPPPDLSFLLLRWCNGRWSQVSSVLSPKQNQAPQNKTETSKTKPSKTKPKQTKPSKTKPKQTSNQCRPGSRLGPTPCTFFWLLRGPSVMAYPLHSTSYCTTTAPVTSEQYYYSTTSLHSGRRRRRRNF
jgi:hypothetical protein